MRHFQESYPDRREGRGGFLFPARTRIIKGGFHQLGSLADISAVGIFPRPIIPGGGNGDKVVWSLPLPLAQRPPKGPLSTSQRVAGAQRIPRVLYGFLPRWGGDAARWQNSACAVKAQGQAGSYWEEVQVTLILVRPSQATSSSSFLPIHCQEPSRNFILIL